MLDVSDIYKEFRNNLKIFSIYFILCNKSMSKIVTKILIIKHIFIHSRWKINSCGIFNESFIIWIIVIIYKYFYGFYEKIDS